MAQHPAIIKAAALIHSGDIAAAESALSALVDTEGDSALVAVLDELPPKDLLAIIREFDGAKTSVVNMLVTPAQFADAVIMERLYAERNHDRLRSMINSVIYRDEVEPEEFIAALVEKDLGLEVLADYFDDRFDEISIFKAFGSFVIPDDERTPKDEEEDTVREDHFELPKGGVGLDEVGDSDWMELTWRLAHHHPDEFFHVYQILAARARLAEEVPAKPAAEGEGAEAGSFAPAADKGAPAEESAL